MVRSLFPILHRLHVFLRFLLYERREANMPVLCRFMNTDEARGRFLARFSIKEKVSHSCHNWRAEPLRHDFVMPPPLSGRTPQSPTVTAPLSGEPRPSADGNRKAALICRSLPPLKGEVPSLRGGGVSLSAEAVTDGIKKTDGSHPPSVNPSVCFAASSPFRGAKTPAGGFLFSHFDTHTPCLP